jgi:fatty acid desaturase
MSKVVVAIALVIVTLLCAAMSYRNLDRLTGQSSMTEDGARERLSGSYWAAVWSIGGILAGLGAVIAAWQVWPLIPSALPTILGLMGAGFLHGARGDSWYQRYQMGRITRGLPPRRWWDGRLD